MCCSVPAVFSCSMKCQWYSVFQSIFFIFLYFSGLAHDIMKFPGEGSNLSYLCQTTPEPHPHLQHTSVTYTTAQINTGPLTHWVKPGIEPASSWILVGFIPDEPQWALLLPLCEHGMSFEFFVTYSILSAMFCSFQCKSCFLS